MGNVNTRRMNTETSRNSLFVSSSNNNDNTTNTTNQSIPSHLNRPLLSSASNLESLLMEKILDTPHTPANLRISYPRYPRTPSPQVSTTLLECPDAPRPTALDMHTYSPMMHRPSPHRIRSPRRRGRSDAFQYVEESEHLTAKMKDECDENVSAILILTMILAAFAYMMISIRAQKILHAVTVYIFNVSRT